MNDRAAEFWNCWGGTECQGTSWEIFLNPKGTTPLQLSWKKKAGKRGRNKRKERKEKKEEQEEGRREGRKEGGKKKIGSNKRNRK